MTQKKSVYGHILIYKCHKFTQAFPFLHKGPSWQPVLSLKYRMSTARRARARASDRRNTERETINRICNENISIVLNYLLKVNLRFKSQHAVWIFYESRNFKGITACNYLNINMRRSITAFYRIKKWQWRKWTAEHSSHLLVNTESLLSLLLFTFVK